MKQKDVNEIMTLLHARNRVREYNLAPLDTIRSVLTDYTVVPVEANRALRRRLELADETIIDLENRLATIQRIAKGDASDV